MVRSCRVLPLSLICKVFVQNSLMSHPGIPIVGLGKARAARRKMIAANLPLVSFIAKEFHGRGLSHQELCQEGARGLMRSTEKFDISHNTKFSTYSYFRIREALSQNPTVSKEQSFLHRKSLCSAYPAQSLAPLTKEEEYECFADVQDLLALEKKKAELEGKLGRAPSYQEWADHVGCSLCRLYARLGKARAARRKMIAANLPLVSFIAKEFHGRGLSHQELCQEGARGLMRSTQKFDISHNTKFSTYSYFWIRERMSVAVQKFQSICMAGRSLQRKVSFLLRCRDEFCKLNGRNPSMDELSATSNIDKIKIRQAFFVMRTIRTYTENKYNDKCTDGKEIQVSENDSPWRGIWQDELIAEFQVLLHSLSPRESQVLRMRYGLYEGKPLNLFQIAGLLKLTHEAVRKTEKSAFEKLKKSATEVGLQHYLSQIPN